MKLKPNTETEYEAYKTNNSSDPYSARVVSYGEDWANLMEARLSKGEQLADIAKETSHEADTDGITGFMYGCAVSALSHFWEHGETLRRWHNKDTQIGQEGDEANEAGGVLNPALLQVKV
jgi:hypothetical protein